MRSKEEAHDYRYFPEPDLVPVLVDDAWIARGPGVAAGTSRGAARPVRRATLGLPRYDADVLTAEKAMADYFEEALRPLLARRRAPTAQETREGGEQLGDDGSPARAGERSIPR